MAQHFPFIQFEFTHALGPPKGRYLVVPPPAHEDPHAADPHATPVDAYPDPGAEQMRVIDEQLRGTATADVLLIQVEGAPPARRGRIRRAPREESSDVKAKEVALTVATVIYGTHPLDGSREGDELLRTLVDDAGAEEWIGEALRIVNRAVAAYRACAADPYVFDVSRSDPRTIRIGHGDPEQVYGGRWQRAVSVLPPPAPKLPRTAKLMPSQGTAAVLGRQASVLESESMLLRVTLDLDHERPRAAAVGLQAALDLLLNEMHGMVLPAGVQKTMERVIAVREPVAALAKRAQRGPLGEDDERAVREHADTIGGLVDRWRYEPLGFA